MYPPTNCADNCFFRDIRTSNCNARLFAVSLLTLIAEFNTPRRTTNQINGKILRFSGDFDEN